MVTIVFLKENFYNKIYKLQGTIMKKFIIIIACSFATGIALAVNNENNPNKLPANEAQNLYTDNIKINNTEKLNSKIQELLKPNDIIVTMASVGMDSAVPYPGFLPKPFYPHPIIARNPLNFPLLFKYKTVGIISAVGSEITKYKIGDMIILEKLNDNSSLHQEPDNLEDQKNSLFSYPKYNGDKNINIDGLEKFPTTINAKRDLTLF